jgi:hypothetical protein
MQIKPEAMKATEHKPARRLPAHQGGRSIDDSGHGHSGGLRDCASTADADICLSRGRISDVRKTGHRRFHTLGSGMDYGGISRTAMTTKRSSKPDIIPLKQTKKAAILAAVEHCGGNVPLAAEKLEIGATTLYRKLKLYGIASKRRPSKGRNL